MNKSTPLALPVALALAALLVAGPAFSAGPPGYASSAEGVAVNPFGECWRGGFWTKSDAVVECDPDLVKPMVETAAVEVPAAVIVKKEITIQADTQFAFDSATLTPEGQRTLDELAATLDKKDGKVRITGHTDKIGPLDHNLGLSQRRAQAVAAYLATKGVNQDEMVLSGVGPEAPLVSCEGKRGSALVECLAPNRRTEIEFSAFELIEKR